MKQIQTPIEKLVLALGIEGSQWVLGGSFTAYYSPETTPEVRRWFICQYEDGSYRTGVRVWAWEQFGPYKQNSIGAPLVQWWYIGDDHETE